MKPIKTLRDLPSALVCALLITACGSEDSPTNTAGSDPSFEGSFRVEVSNGAAFSETTPRAQIEHIRADFIGLKAHQWHVRVDPRRMEDGAVGFTTELGRNNTMLQMPFEMDGKPIRIGCDPSNPVQGRFERTELTETHISGSFSYMVHACSDYYSGEDLAVPGLPWTITGQFDGLPLSEP